jgi:hypothetical protein
MAASCHQKITERQHGAYLVAAPGTPTAGAGTLKSMGSPGCARDRLAAGSGITESLLGMAGDIRRR